MKKKICLVAILVIVAPMSALAAMPYAQPDKWHEVVIDGQRHTIAEIDGWAVVEGDILLGPIDEVIGGDTRALFRRNLWPDGVVGYAFHPSLPSMNISTIESVIQHIESTTSIVFEERDTGDRIVFTPPTSNVCQSFIGRQGGAQSILLAPACNFANTVHEILHALAFYHEHQRPDRDEYITVDLDQACLFTGSNFAIIDRFSSDQMGPYDYGSVMHYYWNTFSCTGQATIIGPPGVPLGSLLYMSELDQLAVEWLYFVPEYSTDDDSDDVENVDDRCLNIAILEQTDTDDDGFGNPCDPDLNNDGIVNFADLTLFKGLFFGTEPIADFDGDGSVNFSDLAIMKSFFFGEPGPSGRTPGRPQFIGAPVVTNMGDGTVTIDVSWSVAAGLPDRYIVDADAGGGFAQVCDVTIASCSITEIPDTLDSIDLRVRAVAPYGNEGANSSVLNTLL